MLEFYPPLPSSLNRQSESGPPTMVSAAPPIPFRPANDNNDAGKNELSSFMFSSNDIDFHNDSRKRVYKVTFV